VLPQGRQGGKSPVPLLPILGHGLITAHCVKRNLNFLRSLRSLRSQGSLMLLSFLSPSQRGAPSAP
jgi:hypothetical protein